MRVWEEKKIEKISIGEKGKFMAENRETFQEFLLYFRIILMGWLSKWI